MWLWNDKARIKKRSLSWSSTVFAMAPAGSTKHCLLTSSSPTRVNSAGLQLAYLAARPVGLHVLRPGQPNQAVDVLKRKFFCSGQRPATSD